MPMPQYNGPVYAQGPTAVGPYNLQGYQPTFGYNPQQTYMPQTPQPVPSQEPMAIPRLIGRSISANDQIPPKEIPSDGSPAYFPMQDGSAILVKVWTGTPRSSKPRPSLDFPKETNNQQNNIRRNYHVRFE